MELRVIRAQHLIIPDNRQRREFDPQELVKLADSIAGPSGLMHPIVIRKDGNMDRFQLVAGERRIRAIQWLWGMGREVRCGGQPIPEGYFPCLNIGDMDPVDAFEAELEENIRRSDITWQERADATAKLMDLRSQQAARKGEAAPTVADIVRELHGSEKSSDSGGAYTTVREDLIVSQHLSDPDVAKAGTAREAMKILKRKEQLRRSEELGVKVGKTFGSHLHTLYKADAIEQLKILAAESFDVILTDPPYGINAQDFNDSGGKAAGGHFYDDSHETWIKLMSALVYEGFRIAKPQAHCYCFCDIDRFDALKQFFSAAGWKVFRTPFIWVNPTSQRAPWPEQGPHRKWQMILYAVKGNRPVTALRPDVLEYPSDENLNHHAQKPVALYEDLLRRSVAPGNTVIDPFAGTGTIFPAAHGLQCIATGIEQDPAAYGISVSRLGELK